MPLGAAQAQDRSSAKALLARGAAGGGLRRSGGCSASAVRPAPRLVAEAPQSLRPRETTRRPQARAAVLESRGRAGDGARPPCGSAGERAELPPPCRSGAASPSFLLCSAVPPLAPCGGGAAVGPVPAGRSGAGAEEAGGGGGGGTHVLCTCRSISRISVNLSRRSMGSCSITAGTRGCGREGGGRGGASQSLAAVGEGGCRLLAAASPGSPAPAVPGRPAPPPRTHSLSR